MDHSLEKHVTSMRLLVLVILLPCQNRGHGCLSGQDWELLQNLEFSLYLVKAKRRRKSK
jgi:hypothetical protein